MAAAPPQQQSRTWRARQRVSSSSVLQDNAFSSEGIHDGLPYLFQVGDSSHPNSSISLLKDDCRRFGNAMFLSGGCADSERQSLPEQRLGVGNEAAHFLQLSNENPL